MCHSRFGGNLRGSVLTYSIAGHRRGRMSTGRGVWATEFAPPSLEEHSLGTEFSDRKTLWGNFKGGKGGGRNVRTEGCRGKQSCR